MSGPVAAADSGAMSEKSRLVIRPAHDLGGLPPGGPLVRTERELTPFENFCHALLNVLDVHKLVNTEEKRRAWRSWVGRSSVRSLDLGHLLAQLLRSPSPVRTFGR